MTTTLAPASAKGVTPQFEDEVRGLITKWQKLLLLQDWRIEVVFTMDLGDNLALTETHGEKQDALIQIASDWNERATKTILRHSDIEETIVHELLHVKDAPFREALEAILATHMSSNSLAAVEPMLRQLRERAIDSLATGLVGALRFAK